jgi:hypothetical protein
VPGISSKSCTRILEWLVLEPCLWKSHGATVGEEAFAVGGDKVGHRPALPEVAVQP